MAYPNTVQMVPEKYRKTRFLASCWFYLSQNPDLTFQQYQKTARDKICRESVFDDVKRDMELDRLFNRPEAIRIPGTDFQGKSLLPPPVEPVTAPLPNPVLASAILNGLKNTGDQPKRDKEPDRKTVTHERRFSAEVWLRENPFAGFAQFKEHHMEPDFDKAWYDAAKRRLAPPPPPPDSVSFPQSQTKEDPLQMATDKKNKKIFTGDAAKIREYLSKLPKSKLEGLSSTQYSKDTGHKIGSPASFYVEKKKILVPGYQKARVARENIPREPKSPVAIRRDAPKPVQAQVTGNLFITLAEIPLSELKCPPSELKTIVSNLVRALHPRGHEARILFLTDPPILEVRVPFE
jgi:hypothetical protein